MVETQPQVEAPPGRKPLTEDEFMAHEDDGRKYELVDGEAKEAPTGGRHGRISMHIGRLLGPFADHQGALFDSSTGFRTASGNIRSPDVAFMRWERLPNGEVPEGFVDGAPDLAVEVISVSEDQADMARKVVDYLNAGAKQVWQVYPESRRVVVYRSLDLVHTHEAEETLPAEDLFPGFSCSVADLFATSSSRNQH